MSRLTECEESFDRCSELARDTFALTDLLGVAMALSLLFGFWFFLRRLPSRRDLDEMHPNPQYEERVQELQALKSGRLWGDLAQREPEW